MLACLDIKLFMEQVGVTDELDATVVTYFAKICNITEAVRRTDLIGHVFVILKDIFIN